MLAPVCGADGITYDNDCLAGETGAKIDCEGECPCSPQCPPSYNPVCGADSITHDNDCEAEKAGVEIVCEGYCPCPVCPDIYDPVCAIKSTGDEEKPHQVATYDSECKARADGYDIICLHSTCPCPPSTVLQTGASFVGLTE